VGRLLRPWASQTCAIPAPELVLEAVAIIQDR